MASMLIVYFNNDGTIDVEYSTVGVKKEIRQKNTTVKKVCNLVEKAAQQSVHPTAAGGSAQSSNSESGGG